MAYERSLALVLTCLVGNTGMTLAQVPSKAPSPAPSPEAYYYDYAGTDQPTPFSKRCNLTAYWNFYNREFDTQSNNIGDPDDPYTLSQAYFTSWFFGIKETYLTAYTLTNGMVMDRANMRCQEGLHALTKDLAGRQGPLKELFYWDAMCQPSCKDSDAMHQAALQESGCLCTELSVTDDDTATDDRVSELWCQRNSARMLCAIHGLCGVWDCAIEDFMCPRYEYNREFVDGPGGGRFGDCRTSGARRVASVVHAGGRHVSGRLRVYFVAE